MVKAYDVTPFRRVVDVGGESGAFVAGLLSTYPTVSAVVFDQPHVAANLEPVLADGPLADRCTVVGGDFFSGVPEGADAYVLTSVIHDWPDAESIEILAACRAGGGAGSTVLLVERARAGPNERPDNQFSDLNMLVGPGGQERRWTPTGHCSRRPAASSRGRAHGVTHDGAGGDSPVRPATGH